VPTQLITKETAAAYARKSHAPGSARHLEKPAKQELPHTANDSAQAVDDYLAKRQARVRKQLDRVDKLMLTEQDPAKLDRLASAQTRLSEQERILDGRPLLAAVKTVGKGRKDRQSYAAPLPEAEPEKPGTYTGPETG